MNAEDDMHELVQPALEQLGITPFIRENGEIMETLRVKMKHAWLALEKNSDQIPLFATACLPLGAGLIHVGTNMEAFNRAVAWTRQTRPEAPPLCLLATLVFLQVVDEIACNCPVEDPDRKMWENARKGIRERIAAEPRIFYL